MYLIAVFLLPVIVAVLFVIAVRSDLRTDRDELLAILAERGVATPTGAADTTFSVAGVVDGVDVLVDRRALDAERQLEIRASPRAEVALPGPVASGGEVEVMAREAMSALTSQRLDVERDGDVVRLRLHGLECSREIVDRAVDVALALVRGVEPSRARTFYAPSRGNDRMIALGTGAVASLVLAIVLPSCSASVRTALQPFSCRKGETFVVVEEHDSHGTGYDHYCRTPDGKNHWYGCATSLAAGFDACLPVTYAVALVGLLLRRRARAARHF